MPPHCDTLDGPVVKAAKKALEAKNVNLILPWVQQDGEEELKEAFKKTLHVRELGPEARDLADYWFFETSVRVHREGEGAPYTGLKPAGLDWGPVVARAEEAIENGNSDVVIGFMVDTVKEALQDRFNRAMATKGYNEANVGAARNHIQEQLGFVLFSHHLYAYIKGGGEHQEGGMGGHKD